MKKHLPKIINYLELHLFIFYLIVQIAFLVGFIERLSPLGNSAITVIAWPIFTFKSKEIALGIIVLYYLFLIMTSILALLLKKGGRNLHISLFLCIIANLISLFYTILN